MYSYEILAKMKGQAVKDIWHSMIGKEQGIRNTTGLKSMNEVIQAILQGQEDPIFLEKFRGRAPKHVSVEKEEETMPGKKNPNPIVVPSTTKKTVLAVESEEYPMQVSVQRFVVKKLIVGDREYFKDKDTHEVFAVENGRPGQRLGKWSAETRSITQEPS